MFYSDREKAVSKAIIVIGSIYIVFLTLLQRIIQCYLPELPIGIQTLLVLALFITTIVILFLGKEKIFGFLFKSSMVLDARRRYMLGAWKISIEYEDQDKNLKNRLGFFNLKSTSGGSYVFEGGKLIDIKDNKVVANSWSSCFADIITNDEDKEIFIYVYCINRDGHKSDDTSEEYDKLGIGVAMCEKNNKKCKIYKGIFTDFKLGERAINERINSGTVSIEKSPN